MMKRSSVGKKLYISVLGIFIAFAAAFILFQYSREKQYKIDALNSKLQSYNLRMAEILQFYGKMDEKTLNYYVENHSLPKLRVTLMDTKGRVFYDSEVKDYASIGNHAKRKEVMEALKKGYGDATERQSKTLSQQFFYSATYIPKGNYIIRTALPYDNTLAISLQADQHYLWFALTAMVILTLLLYRFTSRLGANIKKLRTFAYRADHGESLDTEDLIEFPNDELGEIAERIIKIYRRLQSTKQEQDVLKRQLTQNISHELKTPVASIQGYLETILQNPQINDATKEQFLLRCYAQSERLSSLLRDISTLSRLDDAPDMTTFEEVDLVKLIREVQKQTALQLESRKMTFVDNLPQEIKVKGNQSLLYSVFRNLTDNAIAYAGEGTTIDLEAWEEDDRWKFAFKDNGIGVAREHLPRIFERFYRIDKGRSREMGGTGLGLAIVKNSLLIHGGTIIASKNNDKGLRFDFSIKK